jgi:hypothetical protein
MCGRLGAGHCHVQTRNVPANSGIAVACATDVLQIRCRHPDESGGLTVVAI